jgi:hypothetical protein
MFAVPAVDHVSSISPAQAAGIALRYHGVTGTAERLASEHDDAFRLAGADGVVRLLKISVAPPALAFPVPAGGAPPAGGAAADGPGCRTSGRCGRCSINCRKAACCRTSAGCLPRTG